MAKPTHTGPVRTAEDLVREWAQATVGYGGKSFFETQAEYLAKGLGADYAFVGRVDPKDSNRIRTLAVWAGGRIASNFEYEQTGTPCANVIGQKLCFYPQDVQQKFPEDELLVTMGVQAYIGAPIFDRTGPALAIISALWKRPISDTGLQESVLKVFADRAGAELERLRRDEELSLEREHLQLAMQRLALATRSAKIGIWDWNVSTDELTWDEQMYALYGVRAEDFGGAYEAWESAVHPDDLARARAGVEEALEGVKEFHTEFRVVWPSGEVRHIEGHGTVLRSPDGTPQRMIGVNWDTTERKHSLLALQEARQFLQRILDTSPSMIFAKDASGKAIFVNKATADHYGTTPEALVGVTTEDVHRAKDEATQYVSDDREVIAQGTTIVKEERNTAFDDSTHWFHTIKVPLERPDGTVAALTVATDITDRVAVEERLRISEARFRTLIEAAPDAIVVLDVETGKFVEFNRKACELFGLPEEELSCCGPAELSADPQPDGRPAREAAAEFVRRAVEGEEVVFEWLHLSSDGREIPCEVRLVRLPDPARILVRGSITDITARKQEEQARHQLAEQLQQAQKMESIGRLAGGVAHDFNNLLSVILGYAELAMMDAGPESPLSRYLDRITKAAKRGSSLTHQLLAFARRKVIQPKLANLNQLVADLDSILRRLIGEDIELTILPGASLDTVKVDVDSFSQVLINMVVNARDAMPRGGKLTVETLNVTLSKDYAAIRTDVTPGSYVALIVADTGEGIAKDIQDRVFEPFFTTKPVGQGTGLGLSMCQGIVKQAGGHIAVYSEPGKGTTFKVYLPRVDGDPRQSEPAAVLALSKGGSETVLFVEDEEMVREFAVQALKQLGYRVLDATNGEEALEQVAQLAGPVDLLVTDVVMPRMGGTELARRLQSPYPNLKVIYCSGYTENVIVSHGILNEGVNFIQKPYTPSSLAENIRRVLDQGSL